MAITITSDFVSRDKDGTNLEDVIDAQAYGITVEDLRRKKAEAGEDQ